MDGQDMGVGRAFVPTASDPQAVPPVPASIPDALREPWRAFTEMRAWKDGRRGDVLRLCEKGMEIYRKSVADAQKEYEQNCTMLADFIAAFTYLSSAIAADASSAFNAQGIEAGTVETARLDAQHESPVRQDAPISGSPTTTLADSDGEQ